MSELWPSEKLVSDAIGRLIEFWGFKRNMGRVWAVLYLSETPLTAKDLQERLSLTHSWGPKSGRISHEELRRYVELHRVVDVAPAGPSAEELARLLPVAPLTGREPTQERLLEAGDSLEGAAVRQAPGDIDGFSVLDRTPAAHRVVTLKRKSGRVHQLMAAGTGRVVPVFGHALAHG